MQKFLAFDRKITKVFFERGKRHARVWIFLSVAGFPLMMVLLLWQISFQLMPMALSASAMPQLTSRIGMTLYTWVVLVAWVTVPAFAITALLQFVFRRERPTERLHGTYHAFGLPYSFPSVHASIATSLAVLSAFLGLVGSVQSSGWIALICVAAAAVLAFFIAASRVFLGVHYLTDVIVGAALGAVLACAMLSVGVGFGYAG